MAMDLSIWERDATGDKLLAETISELIFIQFATNVN